MYLTDRSSVDGARRGRRGYRVSQTVLLMGLVSMFTDISSESVSAILPLYLTAVVGLSPLAYGFIDGVFQGVSALVRILGGVVADRTDHPKWVAAAGYGLSACTRLALIPLHGLAAITTVISVDRIGKGIRTGPRDAVIANASTPETLGQSFGVHRALDTLGAVIGPLVAFAILSAIPQGFTSVFVVSFMAAVVGFALLVFIVPDVRPKRSALAAIAGSAMSAENLNGLDTSAPPATAAKPSFRLLADRRLAMVVAAAGLLGFLTVGDGFLYLALQHRDNFAVSYFPLLYVGTNMAYLVLAVPMGRLADRIGRTKVYLAGHVFLVGAYLGSVLVAGTAATLACLLLLGVYYAATDGVLTAIAGSLVSPLVRATGISTVQTVVAIARFGSSLGFGILWTVLGQRAALELVAVMLVLALPLAASFLRVSERPETSDQPTEKADL